MNVESIELYLDSLKQLQDRMSKLFANSLHFYYRGMANATWHLLPTLLRSRDGDAENTDIKNTYFPYEAKILEQVETEYPAEMSSLKTYPEKLAWMQHYGFPTRLLDVTSNPLVALFFAVSDRTQLKENGRVCLFGVEQGEYRVSMIKGNKRFAQISPGRYAMKDKCLKEGGIKNNRKGYLGPCLIRVPAVCERQRRQAGEFFLMNNCMYDEDLYLPSRSPMCVDDGELFGSVEIAQDAKSRIRLDLANRFGISRHNLFPESPQDYVDDLVASLG